MKKSAPFTAVAAGFLTLTACSSGSYDPTRPDGGRAAGSAVGSWFGELLAVLHLGGDTAPTAAGTKPAAVPTAPASPFDAQAKDLSRTLTARGATVTPSGERLIVTLPADQLFAPDSYDLRATQKTNLLTLAGCLNRYPGSSVEVIGYSDAASGDATYTRKLSRQRAEAVARELTGAGVPPARIRTLGRGAENPVASDNTAEGQARNRRIEIVLRPMP